MAGERFRTVGTREAAGAEPATARRCGWTWWLGAVAVLVPVLTDSPLAGQDFRVETEVYAGKDKSPFAETLTIFHDAYVYDFMLQPSRDITMFDLNRKRILLLDPARRVQTTVALDQLLELTGWMRTQLRDKDPALAAEAEFQLDVDQRQLTVRDALFEYSVKGATPPLEDAARRYQGFADWYARLNATRPGNPPPFARIQLNEQLAQQGWMPVEIERTSVRGGKSVIRSRHFAVWKLSNKDQERIKAVGDMIAKFTPIRPEQYWKAQAESEATP